MKLSATLDITDNPNQCFTQELAALTGEDGSKGSISLVVAPTVDTHGDPAYMGIRASDLVEFEHEGRRGRLKLSDLFCEWVDAIGDRPEDEVAESSEEEMNAQALEIRERRKREFEEDKARTRRTKKKKRS